MSERPYQAPARVDRARKTAELRVASTAKLRHLKVSAQKTRLVVDQIRGMRVDEARAILRVSQKAVARDLLKLLMSAVANTENAPGGGTVETEELYVTRAEVGQGPVIKRIQPAPMGRAFPIHKRSCHVTLELGTLSSTPRQATPRKRARAARTAAAK